jgi:thiol-disulfide isomerase/thioredoxin
MSKKRSAVLVVLLLILLLGVAMWFTYSTVVEHREKQSDAGQVLIDNDTAERFTDINGSPVELASAVGKKVIYVNSWASWSPLSRDELIALNEVAAEFKDKPVTFIALNRRETLPLAQAYLATLPPLTNLNVVVDSTDEFYKDVSGYAMPETVLYTKDGALWRHERQPQDTASIRALVNELLAQE